MDDKTKDLLWKENVDKRIKDIKLMLLGILLIAISCGIRALYGDSWDDVGILFEVSFVLLCAGAVIGIIGFFRDRNW